MSRRRLIAAVAVLCGGVAVGGCASGADLPLPAVTDARGSLIGQRLGESRDAVLAALGAYAPPPRCTFSRLVPEGARRTFPMERCEHDVDASGSAPRLAGQPVARAVTYFVDDRLVRIDAAFADGADILPAAPGSGRAASADAADEPAVAPEEDGAAVPSGSPRERVRQALVARLGGEPERWRAGPDRVRLLDGERDADGADALVRLAVIDGRVAAAFPALAEDAPATTR